MLSVTAYFVCGVLAGRVLREPARISHVLNLWVVNVALPGLILAKLPALALGQEIVVPFAVSWGIVALGAGSVFALARAGELSRKETGALLLVVPLGNTSFLGLPVVEALLGRDHIPSALAFDQLGSFLALATYGLFVAGRFGSGERGWRPVVRRLTRFGPFLALLGSIVLRAVDLPAGIHDVLVALGRTVAPVGVMSMGMRFVPRLRFRRAGVIASGLALKMIMMPAAVLLVAVIAGDPSAPAWQSSIVEAAMPPMVTAGVVGISAGFDEDLIISMVALGTIVALTVMSLVSLVV